tara:strand:- start:2567 stop:2716 length:150 start_codon:yes stop_codon:yes gene_type:complete
MNFTNETVLERITAYVENGELNKAEALVAVADQLEEMFYWETSIIPFFD